MSEDKKTPPPSNKEMFEETTHNEQMCAEEFAETMKKLKILPKRFLEDREIKKLVFTKTDMVEWLEITEQAAEGYVEASAELEEAELDGSLEKMSPQERHELEESKGQKKPLQKKAIVLLVKGELQAMKSATARADKTVERPAELSQELDEDDDGSRYHAR